MPIQTITIRNIYVNTKTRRGNDKESVKLNKINSDLARQLDALEKMTKEIKETIKKKEDEEKHNQVKEESTSIKDEEEPTEKDIDEVFASLGISAPTPNIEAKQIESKNVNDKDNVVVDPSVKDLENPENLLDIFPKPKTYVQIPENIKQILPLEVISNIASEETANWEPVIDALLKSGICNPLSNELTLENEFNGYDFHQLVKAIPRKHKVKIVEKLHELALMSGVLWGNIHVMNDLMALTNLMSKEKAKILMETLISDIEIDFKPPNKDEGKHIEANEESQELQKHEDKLVANVTTKAIILNHYARMGDVKNVRKYVNLLNGLPTNENPMNTSPIIYTSIMQMYIRLNDYQLAKETFDTMKFLSLKTSPSAHTYTSMVLMDTLNNNIEHGVSVYEEMVEKNIKPEPEALLALAKGCGARRGMVSQGWDFLIKYYENGYPVDSQVMEIMMYLAYVDSDLPFVRGIWMNICETNTKLNAELTLPHARCTKWLFNTYYRTGDVIDDLKNDIKHVPVGLVDPRVRAIRKKVLELTNFGFHENAPPLLPIIKFDGVDTKLMLKESHALWKYLTEFHDGNYISAEIVEAYLYVLGRYGSLDIFENEWNSLTVFDNSSIKDEEHVTIEEPEEIPNESEPTESTDIINKASVSKYSFGKRLREDRLYSMCMHTSRHQKSLSFAQKIWTERGKYRQSEHFQKLTPSQQDNADFKFARLMLSTLTETGNVGDAYKLVLSSQNRFVWNKYHLKALISLCERLGFVTFSKELIKVIKRGDKWTRRQSRQNRK